MGKTHQNKQGNSYLSANLEHILEDFGERKPTCSLSTCAPLQFKHFISISSQ